jgi:DsbC/DsbD-like thiol-disulfide interchange protein
MMPAHADAHCPARRPRLQPVTNMKRQPMKHAAILAFALAAAPAWGGSSGWEHAQGGAVRMVVAAGPQPDGRLRGALEIDLKPGWKTYWLDPGSSGVPPTIELVSGDSRLPVQIDLPAPKRFDEGYASFAGYDAPVSLAVSFEPPAGWTGEELAFGVFIGICETICIPVQAELAVQAGEASPEDEQAVAAAFGALPGEPRPEFGVSSAWVEGDELIVRTAAPQGEAELFVASTASFALGEPMPTAGGFRVPLLDRPTGPVAVTENARYTLVSGGAAVSGTIAISGHP